MGYLPSIATTSLILLSILYCSVSRNPPLGTLNKNISVCFEQSFPKILNVFREFSLGSSVHTLEYPNSSLILAWKKDFSSFPSFPTTQIPKPTNIPKPENPKTSKPKTSKTKFQRNKNKNTK